MQIPLNIVNNHLSYQKVTLIRPSESYYLHIAAEIDHSPLPFFVTTSAKKKRLIQLVKNWCGILRYESNVLHATVFKARLIPPGKGKFIQERKSKVHIAKFDLAILIEATCPRAIENIRNSARYKEIEQEIRNIARSSHIITATNSRHISPVDHSQQGVFLFNYFFADDLQQNLATWEYTAGWFQQETGLDNSTVLLPLDPQRSHYTIINHCRWDKMTDILPSLVFKRSFRSYVLANFSANKVAAMPVLYKLA